MQRMNSCLICVLLMKMMALQIVVGLIQVMLWQNRSWIDNYQGFQCRRLNVLLQEKGATELLFLLKVHNITWFMLSFFSSNTYTSRHCRWYGWNFSGSRTSPPDISPRTFAPGTIPWTFPSRWSHDSCSRFWEHESCDRYLCCVSKQHKYRWEVHYIGYLN